MWRSRRYLEKQCLLPFSYANFLTFTPDIDIEHHIKYQKFYLHGNDLAKSCCVAWVIILKTSSFS